MRFISHNDKQIIKEGGLEGVVNINLNSTLEELPFYTDIALHLLRYLNLGVVKSEGVGRMGLLKT